MISTSHYTTFDIHITVKYILIGSFCASFLVWEKIYVKYLLNALSKFAKLLAPLQLLLPSWKAILSLSSLDRQLFQRTVWKCPSLTSSSSSMCFNRPSSTAQKKKTFARLCSPFGLSKESALLLVSSPQGQHQNYRCHSFLWVCLIEDI